MTEYINSFFSNIMEKASNPFLGTIILVILLRYWEVFYTMLTFDADCDMLAKQTYIHNYFAVKDFWAELGWIILDSFAVLVGTYCLIAGSRLIVNVFNKHILSRADKITDKNSVKTLAEYNAIENRLAEAFENLRKVNNDNNELELRVGQYKNEVSSIATELSSHKLRADEAEISNINLDKDISEKDKIIKEGDMKFKISEELLKQQTNNYDKARKNLETLKSLMNSTKSEDYSSYHDFECRTPEAIVSLTKELEQKDLLEIFLLIGNDVSNETRYRVKAEPRAIPLIEMELFITEIDIFNDQMISNFTLLGEMLYGFASQREKSKMAYLKSRFKKENVVEFSSVDSLYESELQLLANNFGNGFYIPADFRFSNDFINYMTSRYYMAYNKGFLEFTNKGLRLIDYLQNIYY